MKKRADMPQNLPLMFFYLSKTIYILAMPLTWVFLILLFALLMPKRRKALLIANLVLLYLLSCPVLVKNIMAWWEQPVTPLAELAQHDVGIVLTGVTDASRKPFDRVYTTSGADRALHAGMLYQKGYIKHILITGGGNPMKSVEVRPEAELLKILLKQMGIPDSAITVEPHALNTHQNAAFAAEILKARHPNQQYLLITSAFHMNRAMGCFRQEGIIPTPFSTDFKSGCLQCNTIMSYIPTASSFENASILVHEWVGYIVYDLVGYL